MQRLICVLEMSHKQGAMYEQRRAVFTTMEQTVPLKEHKVRVPVVALCGKRTLGGFIRRLVELVAENVSGGAIPDCAHFVVEERPEEIARQILTLVPPAGRQPAP